MNKMIRSRDWIHGLIKKNNSEINLYLYRKFKNRSIIELKKSKTSNFQNYFLINNNDMKKL